MTEGAAHPADLEDAVSSTTRGTGVTLSQQHFKERVAGAAAESDEHAEELLAVATALVERYAPNAPSAIANAAATRIGGYLSEADFGGVAKEIIGPLENEYVVNHANAFRLSGAAALLSGWRVRRAGSIG